MPTVNRRLLDLHDTRCPHCGASPLRGLSGPDQERSPADADGGIDHGAIYCASCTARYDIIWGAPFLGAFDDRDIIGLIEIAANAQAKNSYPDSATIRRLERLLVSYHKAADRAVFMRNEPDDFVRAPWFQNRYHEWLQFTTMAEGISLAGCRALDVGAGTGVDSYRLVAAGADVTALEYNPMLVRRGLGAVPEARWFGGLSHALPFASGSFDVVCCNAALHHMRDVETSLEEMLRVLKPGGWLVTTGDPYRARHLGAEHELAVFNHHPDVLRGINESIPSFAAFEAVLTKYRDALDIKVVTGELHPAISAPSGSRHAPLRHPVQEARRLGARLLGGFRANPAAEIATGMQSWDFDRDRQALGDSSGSIALRCRVRKQIAIAPGCQGPTVLPAGEYAQSLTDYEKSIRTLARYVPSDHVNRPFPGTNQIKFELLNGWLAPTGAPIRSAYRRARWFLRRPAKAEAVTFEVRQPNVPLTGPCIISVLINGVVGQSLQLASANWYRIAIPVLRVPCGDVFALEIQLDSRSDSFDEGLFEVRDRTIG
jgi:SAM-dependent methyltransferase